MKKLWIARIAALLLAAFALFMTIYVAGDIVLTARYEQHWNLVNQRLDEECQDLLIELDEVNREWSELQKRITP